jgi:transforming growth factor-beta-induced protein
MKFLFGLSILFAHATCVDAQWRRGKSIAEIASEEEDLSTLVTFLDKAGLVPVLDSRGRYTVFAPVNDAFDKLPSEVVAKYNNDDWINHLQSLLLYHGLGQKVYSSDLSVGLKAKTLEGNIIEVTSLDPVKINDSEVISADIQASNGVVHTIDTVLLPPSATDTIVDIALGNPDFTTLVDLLSKADLVETLDGDGPFTVFAPTNDAFSQLPTETVDFLVDPKNVEVLKQVLLYHVVSGIAVSSSLEEGQNVETVEGSKVSVSLHPVTINNALVIKKDILASNGVIHVIDSVLLPPNIGSIADIIKSDATFSTLASLVDKAGLTSTLEGDGPYTLFAPTNQAFGKLPSSLVEDVTSDDALLTDVLTYHVLPSKVLASDLKEGLRVETASPGNFIEITSLHPPTINTNAHIVAYDILAKNGVVHIITSVLIPEDLQLDDNESCTASVLCKSQCCAQTLFYGKLCRDKKWYTYCV